MSGNRITIEKLNSYRFLKTPKELIFNLDKYGKLSVQAILLYGLLHDRLELSAKNGWINEDGEIYLKFKKEVLMKLLRIGSKTTITNVFKELKNAELIEEKQVGLNMANEIYLLEAEFSAVQITDDEILELDKIEKSNKNQKPKKSSKINGSTENGRPENVPPEVQKMYASETNSNETNLKEEDEESIMLAYKEVKDRYLNSVEKKKLRELLQYHSKDLILKAIDVMVTDAEKITLKYITSTLQDWKTKGIQTVDEVDKMRLEWQESKKKHIRKPTEYKPKGKVSNFNNFKQRDYDFNDLEKKLTDHEEVLKEADCSKCVVCRNGKCFIGKELIDGKCANYNEKNVG